MRQKRSNVDWIIHVVTDGYCEECEKFRDEGFLPYTCNAHTHGMERYGHLNFQFVLRLEYELICFILNEFGRRVQAGEKFEDGDVIEDVLTCPITLKMFEEMDRSVLRIIVPDGNFRFPEDEGCDEVYKYQLLPTEMLSIPENQINQ